MISGYVGNAILYSSFQKGRALKMQEFPLDKLNDQALDRVK